jgi:hypothetical protein
MISFSINGMKRRDSKPMPGSLLLYVISDLVFVFSSDVLDFDFFKSLPIVVISGLAVI